MTLIGAPDGPARPDVPLVPLERVSAAPINWGVCEVPGWGRVLEVDRVLGEMAQLGLRATELGPPGFLPEDGAEVAAQLARHDLRLVGAFLAVVLHDVEQVDATLVEAERASAQIAAGGGEVLVLAAATGLDGYDERPRLDPQQWATLVSTCAAIRAVAERHGLRTVLHPHVGTHVERQGEVEAFLADSDLDLCLDTGHLLIGGTDPVALARSHPERIAHVHLKDVDAAIAERVRGGELSYMQGVQAGMYTPLGAGDVAVADVVGALERSGYTGWYVLEQDTALPPATGTEADADVEAKPLRDTTASLAFLAALT